MNRKEPTLESLKTLLRRLESWADHPALTDAGRRARYDILQREYARATAPPTPGEALAEFCEDSATSTNVSVLRSESAYVGGFTARLLNALADHLEAQPD